MDPIIVNWIVGGLGVCVAGLVYALWGWAREKFNDHDDALALERRDREQDRHDHKDALATVANNLNRFELQVAKEYVSVTTLEKMEDRILGELREITLTQRQIFAELKQKQDKT